MNTYKVLLIAEPTQGSEEYGQVDGAHVYAYVKSPSIAEAVAKASDHVLSRSWLVLEESGANLVLPEQLAQLDELQNSMYRRAQTQGIYAAFSGWRPGDADAHVIEIRRLRDTDKSSPSRH